MKYYLKYIGLAALFICSFYAFNHVYSWVGVALFLVALPITIIQIIQDIKDLTKNIK